MDVDRNGIMCVAGLTLLAVVLTSGCMTPATVPLNGTAWRLVSYDNGTSMVPVLDGTTVTAEFRAEQMGGSAGCNHYFATYATGSINSLRIEGIGSTEMYCTAPGIMDQESTYLALLGKARQYSVEGGTMTFSDEAGRKLLVFGRIVPQPPLPLANTSWNLDGFVTGDSVSSVIAGTRITAVFGTGGSLVGTAGCNQYFGTYAENASSLSLSGIGSTKMFCTAPDGVMVQETEYLNRLAAVNSWRIEENRLTLFDENGKGILEYVG